MYNENGLVQLISMGHLIRLKWVKTMPTAAQNYNCMCKRMITMYTMRKYMVQTISMHSFRVCLQAYIFLSLHQLTYYILGQKRNAAYKTYILYGVYFINLSQTIFYSLSADSWIMSSWGCPGYHCHRTKLIQQFKPTFLSILTSRH